MTHYDEMRLVNFYNQPEPRQGWVKTILSNIFNKWPEPVPIEKLVPCKCGRFICSRTDHYSVLSVIEAAFGVYPRCSGTSGGCIRISGLDQFRTVECDLLE